MTIRWTDRTPQSGSHVLRPDGRVCLLDYVAENAFTDLKRKFWKPIPTVSMRFRCGELEEPREAASVLYYPSPTEEPISCLGCIAKKDKKPE